MTIKKFFRAALAVSALFVGISGSAQAELTNFVGDTTGGATYNRAIEDFSGLSGEGTAVVYNAFKLTADTSGQYAFTLHGDYGFDTFLAFYENAFNPANALQNHLVANDDIGDPNQSGFGTELMAGSSYFLVVSGYGNDDFGKYALTISGPGAVSISAVPEPSTWLMLGLGLAGVAVAARRKSQR